MKNVPTNFSPQIPDHEILRLIGRGSYGEVWLARSVLGTFRAVKTVRRDAFDSARPYEREFGGIQRFEPISRSHEALVDILQVGRNEAGGFFYYIMELADGLGQTALPLQIESYEPLSLSARLGKIGRLAVRDCILIFRGLAIGLSYLHQGGLVHRDIKPSNIIFVGGVAKFADIGLVTTADESFSYVGTEGFIPPEGAGTVAADIYSLGKVLYEAATGKDRTAFPSLPPLDPAAEDLDGLMELNAIWLKACAQLPAERYQSADELASDLALLQAGRSVKRLRLVERRVRNARRLAFIVCLLSLIAVGGGFLAKRQALLERANRIEADRLRERAQGAERTARDSLEEARIAQARAVLETLRVGRRQVTLSLLTNVMNPQLRVQARSLAAAALALPDLIPINEPPDVPDAMSAEPLQDGSIAIHTHSQKEILQTLPAQGEPPRIPLVFSDNGRFLYAGYGAFTERIWDWRDKRVVARLDTNYYTLEFRPGKNQAAVAYVNGTVILHNLPEWSVEKEWRVDRSEQHLQWSPEGSRLLILSTAGQGLVVEANTDRTKKFSGETFAAWHPNGEYIASTPGEGFLNIQSIAKSPDFSVQLRHEAQIVEAVFLPPFPWILASSWDGTSRIWDWHAGTELGRIEATGYGIQFNATNRLLNWRLGMEPGPRAWRLVGNEVHSEIAYGEPRTMSGPYSLSWSGDGKYIAAGDADGVRLWRLEDGSERLFLPGRSEAVWLDRSMTKLLANCDGKIRRWRLERSHDDQFTAQEQAPLGVAPADGKMAASQDGSIVAWLNGSELHVTSPASERVISHGQEMAEIVAVSPDGSLVAVGTRNHIGARVFAVETGKFLWSADVRFGSHLDFSADSRYLAIGTETGCHVFEAKTGQLRWRAALPANEEPSFWEVAFSPDNQTIAWTPKSSTLRLLDASSGAEILTLEYPTRRYITRLAFSPDGHWLAEASNKRAIHFWNIQALREQLTAMKLGWESESPPAKNR